MGINRIAALLNVKCRCRFCLASREFTTTVNQLRALEDVTDLVDWHIPSPERIAAGDRSVYITLFCNLGIGTIDDDFRAATITKFRELAAMLISAADDLTK